MDNFDCNKQEKKLNLNQISCTLTLLLISYFINCGIKFILEIKTTNYCKLMTFIPRLGQIMQLTDYVQIQFKTYLIYLCLFTHQLLTKQYRLGRNLSTNIKRSGSRSSIAMPTSMKSVQGVGELPSLDLFYKEWGHGTR